MKKFKTIYVLYYLGEYYDEFDSYDAALSVKEDYNSFFSDNCEIKKSRVKI